MEIEDSERSLVYIHIGKCGGASLWQSIPQSAVLNKEFDSYSRIHVRQPPILEKARYLIVVRNPIKRALSAFNWRYKLVVEDESQKTRFAGEYAVLKKYGYLNQLAEALYKDGTLNLAAADDFRAIHHLKEDVSFYLSGLLDKITKHQVFGVLATETLNEDVERQLGVASIPRVHENSPQTAESKKYLSKLAYQNLRRFLMEDYACIAQLLDLNHATMASRDDLLGY